MVLPHGKARPIKRAFLYPAASIRREAVEIAIATGPAQVVGAAAAGVVRRVPGGVAAAVAVMVADRG